MGFFDILLGNVSEISVEVVNEEFMLILVVNEFVMVVFKLVWDLSVFMNKCLILIDKQGLIGCKVNYYFIFYKLIM